MPCTRRSVYAEVYTARVHEHVNSRVRAVYTAVYKTRTRPCNCGVYTDARLRRLSNGRPTRPCTCRVHVGPCTRSCTGPVSANMYTAVYGTCVRPAMYTAVYGSCTRTWTLDRVHGSSAMYYYDFLCKRHHAETCSYRPKSITFKKS